MKALVREEREDVRLPIVNKLWKLFNRLVYCSGICTFVAQQQHHPKKRE
jgi:hypothetical protein